MADRTYAGGHVLQWHITHRCNLRCSHCYQSDYGAQMGREALFAALDQYERYVRARALHAQINLTGGEPLRHPDFFSLAREIRRRDMDLGVLTNGTLIGEETAERLAELRPVFVQVSLDGCRRSHDAIRGPGAFRAALAGIDALKRQGVRVNVSFTAQRKNVRELPRLSRICRAHKVDKLWFDRVVIPREDMLLGNTMRKEHYKVTPVEKPPKAMMYTDRNYVVIDLRTGKQSLEGSRHSYARPLPGLLLETRRALSVRGVPLVRSVPTRRRLRAPLRLRRLSAFMLLVIGALVVRFGSVFVLHCGISHFLSP